MCGIIHCKKPAGKRANKTVLKRFETQRMRGTDGFGFVEMTKGVVTGEVRTKTESEIKKYLAKSEADEILFHHRTPTSTPNFIEATHPIRVSHISLKYDYYVIHNGIISNDEELRAEHLKSGFVYTTEITKKWVTSKNTYTEKIWNDSEALAIDFATSLEKNTSMTSEGSIAIIALQFEKKTGKAIALYYGKNGGNPLCVENTKEFFCLSSQTGKPVEADMLYRYDYSKNEITKEVKKIGIYYIASTLGYPYGYNVSQSSSLQSSLYDYDEDDYVLDLEYELEHIKKEIQRAEDEGDTDTVFDLQIEAEQIEEDIKARNRQKICR